MQKDALAEQIEMLFNPVYKEQQEIVSQKSFIKSFDIQLVRTQDSITHKLEQIFWLIFSALKYWFSKFYACTKMLHV